MRRPRDRRSAASVRDRLLERAKRDGSEFQRVLVLYANERVLHRLAQSAHARDFVLKGATLFMVWHGSIPRATKDVDLLGFGAPSQERLLTIFRTVLSTPTAPDGLTFDLATLRAANIREEAAYEGIRLTFDALLATARIHCQFDIGFGDAVDPEPELVTLPGFLDMEPTQLRAYRPECSIAEKYHALVLLGLVNSRMKDYFDIAFLARRFPFEGAVLGRAIASTFARRATDLPRTLPIGLADAFGRDADKHKQWSGFVRRAAPSEQLDLADVVQLVREFLWPITESLARARPITGRWFDQQWHS